MPVLTKINTNSIAEDAITGDKFAGDAYLANSTTQNISGTYSENRLYTSDAYTLSGNATVNSHLTLSTIKSSGDVVLTAGGAYTITGTGVLSGGSVVAQASTDLTGMTGELGSAVTGGSGLSVTGMTGTFEGTINSNTTYEGTALRKIAKVWATINTSANVINGSFNVSSITDVGTGNHDVHFITSMSSTNYAALMTFGTLEAGENVTVTSGDRTVSQVTIWGRYLVWTGSSGNKEGDNVAIAIFGD